MWYSRNLLLCRNPFSCKRDQLRFAILTNSFNIIAESYRSTVITKFIEFLNCPIFLESGADHALFAEMTSYDRRFCMPIEHYLP